VRPVGRVPAAGAGLPPAPDESVVWVEGPWRHRTVSASGTRFHLVESGEGPAVLFLHGFAQFWWTWRHQLTALAQAGFRAVAMDLRGHGASDKPPRGYDLPTLAHDAAGVVRALGEERAGVVGHGSGALVAWTMATYAPHAVRCLSVLSMPHPLLLGSGLRPGCGRLGRDLLASRLPVVPERLLLRRDAESLGRRLRRESGSPWPDRSTERRFRDAIRVAGVAHRTVEHRRWLVRSRLSRDVRRFRERMRAGVTAPTLHLHGARDTYVPLLRARGSQRYVQAPFSVHAVPGAGHHPHEEHPDAVNGVLVSWLKNV
jgi:pimeloyl-ACP methyl ester carboxylesterase